MTKDDKELGVDRINNTDFLDDDSLYKITYENARLEEENMNLKRTIKFYQTEIEKYRTTPFLVSEVINVFDDKAIIRLPNQSNFLVNISNEALGKIRAGDFVINEQKSLTVVDKIDISKNFAVENYIIETEDIHLNWDNIGGLDEEIKKVREVLELPLLEPKKFKDIGLIPPKGILLYGPPGTGKTMIAKALAKNTKATFIELIGSELVQKYIGEGAKLVKDLFELAKKRQPAIIFIDEVDAIAARRIENGTSGEREVQRTFMQLLGEIDGFDPSSNVKIIVATNRKDILDEALLRPGRLDRHIYIGLPNEEGRKEILKLHLKDMRKDRSVNLEEVAKRTKGFSGADLKALVTEAGYLAINKNKRKISQDELIEAIELVIEKKEEYNLETFNFN